MSEFVALERDVSEGTFEDEFVELLEARLEGWGPSEGDQLVWLGKAWERKGSNLEDQLGSMGRSAFRKFGEAVVSVPPIQAAPATVASTWELVDEAGGYEIEAGATVTVEASGARSVAFRVVETVVVPVKATKVSVLLEAAEPGEENNGLSGVANLQTSYAFVVEPGGIELEGVSAGGVDEEEEDAYLNRLVEDLQTLSLSLIKGRDFEIDARSIASIARAKCIEAYNASEGKEEALAVSVYPIDETGEASSAPVKEALKARQTDKLLSGINYYVGTPNYTTIKGKTEVEVEAGFDPAAVKAAIEAFWLENFSAAKWGLPTQGDSGSGWINRTKAYRLKTIGQIERIGGVGRVKTFEWAKGEGALGTAEELSLEGVAPLTKPGTLTVVTA